MDVDSFKKFPLAHLNFKNDTETKSSSENISYDLKKLSSIDTLIEQNEETNTKLKVSLRKQARLEQEILNVKSEIQNLIEYNKSLKDENYVLKENEAHWKIQISNAENAILINSEKLYVLESQNQKYKSEVLRYQKYHEKIKNQVKPYLQQLKEYSASLEAKIENLDQRFIQKETQLRDVRNQILEVTKNTKLQIEATEKQYFESTELYESQINKLNETITSLKNEAEALVLKNFKLQRSFDQQAELENQLIEMTRARETLKTQLETEVLKIQEKNNELFRENRKLQIEHDDLKQRVLSDTENIKQIEKSKYDLEHQLESLRYIWNVKNNESESLKISLQALEKLNLDLSLKVQELRTPATKASEDSTAFEKTESSLSC